MSGESITEILKQDYKDFFDIHKGIYENQNYRQGLFLLGTIIAKIKKAQGDKNINILSKLNYSALSVRRVQTFLNKIFETEQIYKKNIFIEENVWANITDRLQGIEKTNMKTEEIIFYILSGLSYSNYLSQKYSKEKKSKEAEVMPNE